MYIEIWPAGMIQSSAKLAGSFTNNDNNNNNINNDNNNTLSLWKHNLVLPILASH